MPRFLEAVVYGMLQLISGSERAPSIGPSKLTATPARTYTITAVLVAVCWGNIIHTLLTMW